MGKMWNSCSNYKWEECYLYYICINGKDFIWNGWEISKENYCYILNFKLCFCLVKVGLYFLVCD